jgi:hypothetical protein
VFRLIVIDHLMKDAAVKRLSAPGTDFDMLVPDFLVFLIGAWLLAGDHQSPFAGRLTRRSLLATAGASQPMRTRILTHWAV